MFEIYILRYESQERHRNEVDESYNIDLLTYEISQKKVHILGLCQPQIIFATKIKMKQETPIMPVATVCIR